MKRTVLVTMVGLAMVAKAALAQEVTADAAKPVSPAMNLREALINNEQVDRVIAIDDHYTHVFPSIPALGFSSGKIPSDFTKALISSCDTKWQVKGFDPLTSKTGWVPYDGKSDLYSREIADQITKKKEVVNGARCVNRFEITEVWGAWRSLFSDGTGRYFAPLNFIVKHESAQPFKFKEKDFPTKIAMLPDGEVVSLNPEKSASKGFFTKLLTNDKPASFDLFQYVAALCNSQKGKPRGVANDGGSALYEKSLIDTYKQAFAGGHKNTGKEKEWYFACEGDNGFIVRERENLKYDSAGKPVTTTSTFFAAGRGLDGVDFTPIK